MFLFGFFFIRYLEGKHEKPANSNSCSRCDQLNHSNNDQLDSSKQTTTTSYADTSIQSDLEVKTNNKSEEELVECALFFPDKSLVTPSVNERGGFNSLTVNSTSGSNGSPLAKLLTFIRSTKKTLDLCMYVLTFTPLAETIRELIKDGVVVRMVVDSREDEALRSEVGDLARRGVSIRRNKKSLSTLMHHKFALIDSKILLTGSLNWTKSAVLMNYDNVLVTSSKQLVLKYQEQFNQLWNQFEEYSPLGRLN